MSAPRFHPAASLVVWLFFIVALAMLPLSALQIGTADDGLLRDWPQPATDVHKHYGYAFQWFGLSALFALLYVWFQIIAPRRRSRIPSAR